MKYMILGAGGVGATLGYYMYRAGLDVTLIARGEHLERIKENGLVFIKDFEGVTDTAGIRAAGEEEYFDNPDAVFLCVKSFSVDSTIPFLNRVCRKDTVVIPLLNVFTTGEKLDERLEKAEVADGCIYVSSNRDEPGVIRQSVPILRILFGNRNGTESPLLKDIERELKSAGIDITLTNDIRKSALEKFSYVSPIGALGVYYDATAGDFQEEGNFREDFKEMIREVHSLSAAMGHEIDPDTEQKNLSILDSLPKKETTSMQRDINAGRKSEVSGLVHEIANLADSLGVEMKTYRKVSDELKKRGIS